MQSEKAIAIYSRKSRFTGKGESIGNQEDLCREYISHHYGKECRILVYEDEGFSGKNLNRPDFQKMMQAAREHLLFAVIVYRLDRISRNISDFSHLIEELSNLNISFISIREQFDTNNPMGRAMMYIASVFSQLERETIAERIRDNMHELAKTGRWLGGTTPIGYTSQTVQSLTINGKSRKSCQLAQIPREADIVQTIYALYLEYGSLSLTEAELIRRGIQTRNNNYFTRFSLKSILQNPVYAIADADTYTYFLRMGTDISSCQTDFDGIHGIMAYNRTHQEKGKTTQTLPPNVWIISVGAHPGIIPGKTWCTVQKLLANNKTKAFSNANKSGALLSGLLYCNCGSRMYPKVDCRRKIPGYTYVCKMKERSHRSLCSVKNVNGNLLDDAILRAIQSLPENTIRFQYYLNQNRDSSIQSRTDCEHKMLTLQKEKRELMKKIDTLTDSLILFDDSIAREHLAKRIKKMHQKLHATEEQILRLEQNNNCFEEDWTFLIHFADSLCHMTSSQKRLALRTLIHKVVWDGTGATLILHDSTQEEHTHAGEDSK